MERKKDTPARIARRKYEETHKKERLEQNKVWATSIPKIIADDIEEFIACHPNVTKVAIIIEGYNSIKNMYELKHNNS